MPLGFEFVPRWLDTTPMWHRRTFDTLANFLPWEQRRIFIYGRECDVPRLTCWFGEADYVYSGVRHVRAAMPPEIAELRRLVQNVSLRAFNSVLANLYRHGGDSVAWHADDEPELGHEPVIASLTLGDSRRFVIRPRDSADARRWEVTLGHGDLLIMRGRSQADYLHAIPRTTARDVRPRINLTFRNVVTP